MYNNDPKYMNPPEAGLASLLASRGRNGDSVLVHMAPEEVQGLQKLALAHGGSLTINPETGLYEASFLRKLLPTIIGAILPGVPGLGKFAETIGFGSQALGTALIVGGATSLIEGDLKKGLMAGLGAYSGANLAQSLQQASIPSLEKVSPEELVKTNEAIEAAKATVGAKPVYNPTGDAEKVGIDFFTSANKFKGTPTVGDLAIGRQAIASGATTPDQILNYVQPTSAFRGTPSPADLRAGRAAIASNLVSGDPIASTGIKGIFQGAQNLFTSPESRKAFGEGLGGGFQSPFAQSLSKQATFMGLADAFTPEVEVPGSNPDDDLVYMAGDFNPMYGYGREYSYLTPGKYYKKTKKGLVPYNPYAMAPGVVSAAGGGLMQVPGQDINEQRVLPHQTPQFPYPNQTYPLSTVMQSNYRNNSPQPREVVSGYEPKIDPYTGEERFADGGAVFDPTPRYKDPATVDPNADNSNVRLGSNPPTGVAPPKGPPLVQPPPVEPPVGPPPIILPPDNPFDPARQRYMDMINAPPKPPVNTKPVMDYVADLNRRAKNPEFIAFPPGGIGGGTGGDPNKPPPDKPDPDCQAGYTYDRAVGACVPIASVTNPPAPPPSPPGPPGTTITPPPSPPPPPKKEEPKKDEPVKTGEEEDGDEGLLDKLTDYGTQALINMGLSSINPYLGLAYSAYRMFPKKTQNQIKKFFGLRVTDEAGRPIPDLTDEEKASTEEMLQQMYRDAAAAGETTPNKPGSGGVGIPGGTGGSGRPTGGNPAFRAPGSGRVTVVGNDGRTYYQRSDGTYEDEDGNPVDEDGMPIQDTRVGPMYGGGRVRAMQAGGMTMPRSPLPTPNNPYGAAVGEDYNFGFSGGGEMPTEYLAGGKLLEGEGDGMSDSIPAVIRGKGVQRAALADGEFVVPADVVSHLGNGSTKAGAKKLYAMMDRIREARTGRTRQSPAVKADKYLPA
jgi:hypothetical protein